MVVETLGFGSVDISTLCWGRWMVLVWGFWLWYCLFLVYIGVMTCRTWIIQVNMLPGFGDRLWNNMWLVLPVLWDLVPKDLAICQLQNATSHVSWWLGNHSLQPSSQMCLFFLKSQDVWRCHQLFALYVLCFLTWEITCFPYTYHIPYAAKCKPFLSYLNQYILPKSHLQPPRTADIWVCLNQVNQEDCYSSYLRQEGDPPGLDIIRCWGVLGVVGLGNTK